MKKHIHSIILFFSCVLAVQSFAQENGNQFTKFAGFELNTVNLNEVVEKYGPTELIETGSAGGYEARICYRLKEGVLHFLSEEMGGPNHELLGFGVSGHDPSAKCASFPRELLDLELNIAGLRLGLTRTEFENLSLTSVNWKGDTGYTFFSSKKPMSEAEISKLPQRVQKGIHSGKFQKHFDVSVSLIGHFEGDILKEFRVWKVVTY